MALIKGKVIAKFLPWSERRWVGNELQAVRNDYRLQNYVE
jgi:hypothetical protein